LHNLPLNGTHFIGIAHCAILPRSENANEMDLNAFAKILFPEKGKKSS
jgi:hypothetical protein